MDKKILLVEDEKTLVRALTFNLQKEGFLVEAAYDGEEALEKISTAEFDLILLDLMLPRVDGYEVCRKVRKTSDVPIIMLTARDEDIDKILGLELGADDYITKPFNVRELLARIRALFRRASQQAALQNKIVCAGGLEVDLVRHGVSLQGREILLTSREYALLSFLVINAGRVFTRGQLLEQVWGSDYSGDARTVDVHIRHLREKLEANPAEPHLILTVWGTGYKFREG